MNESVVVPANRVTGYRTLCVAILVVMNLQGAVRFYAVFCSARRTATKIDRRQIAPL